VWFDPTAPRVSDRYEQLFGRGELSAGQRDRLVRLARR